MWLAALVLISTAVLMWAVAARVLILHWKIGDEYVHHWLSIAGVLFVGVYTPIYAYFKRRKPMSTPRLLKVHVFGNLLSFTSVSLHFTQQITRPPQAYPDLGTGIVLYAAMLAMVGTGFAQRYLGVRGIYTSLRFVHVGAAVTFYFTILVHMLHGFGII